MAMIPTATTSHSSVILVLLPRRGIGGTRCTEFCRVRDDALTRREVDAPEDVAAAAAAARRGLRVRRLRKESNEDMACDDVWWESTVVERGERAEVRLRERDVRGEAAGERGLRPWGRFGFDVEGERMTLFEVPEESDDAGVYDDESSAPPPRAEEE